MTDARCSCAEMHESQWFTIAAEVREPMPWTLIGEARWRPRAQWVQCDRPHLCLHLTGGEGAATFIDPTHLSSGPRCFCTKGSSLTIELLDRREDVASFANSHRVCVRRNPLPSQRERLNILCDVQVNGHFRRPFPASGPQGNRQRARMFGQTRHAPSAGIGSDR